MVSLESVYWQKEIRIPKEDGISRRTELLFTLRTTRQHCGDEKESCKSGNDACKNVVNAGERNDPGKRLAEGKHSCAAELRLIYVLLTATNQMLPRLQPIFS